MAPTPTDDRVLDCLADAVLTVDLDGRITRFNRAAVALTGVPAERVVGAPCREVLRAENDAVEVLLHDAARSEQPVLNRGVYLDLVDGRRLPASITASTLEDGEGRIVGAVGIVRDLTGVFRGYLAGTAGDPRADLRKELLRLSSFAGIISRNHEMRDLFAILPEIAASSTTVLVQGPSGSGKELFARALHDLSPRRDAPLVAVNCGALPDTLLESELFGYKAGAFTDARRDKSGLLQRAHGGTLFLDEIGDISPAMQVRLLRVLQEREFRPLGATRSVHVDIRVVAATHRDMDTLVAAGGFRQDLFFRLDIVRLRVPPLRARKEDIPLLADHFVERLRGRHGKTISGLARETLELLMRHDFPGNVRELENTLEHAFVLCPGGPLLPEHLPARFRQLDPSGLDGAVSLADLEARFLRRALARNGFSATATARELGIHRSTLWRRLKRLGLERFPGG